MGHPTVSAPSGHGTDESRCPSALERQCCLRWVNRLLAAHSESERNHFWRTPRGSLRGHTPLQALEHGDLRRLREAAEAFAEA